MLHMTKAATITETDQGLFSAVVSTYDLDRQGDRVAPGAFRRTIAEWKSTGRMLPLHWDHGSQPEDIVGQVDPASMEESRAGLTVKGKVDLETARGREAWRLLRANNVGFSFGYLPTQSHEQDGVRILDEVDIFEVTITASPANNRTRVIDLKSLPSSDAEMSRIVKRAFDQLKAARDLPPELTGTWDPFVADGETKGVSRAEIEEELKAQRKAVRRARPVKVVAFQVK
jgi:Escherichia/Staphylococcus phage prohead protease